MTRPKRRSPADLTAASAQRLDLTAEVVAEIQRQLTPVVVELAKHKDDPGMSRGLLGLAARHLVDGTAMPPELREWLVNVLTVGAAPGGSLDREAGLKLPRAGKKQQGEFISAAAAKKSGGTIHRRGRDRVIAREVHAISIEQNIPITRRSGSSGPSASHVFWTQNQGCGLSEKQIGDIARASPLHAPSRRTRNR